MTTTFPLATKKTTSVSPTSFKSISNSYSDNVPICPSCEQPIEECNTNLTKSTSTSTTTVQFGSTTTLNNVNEDIEKDNNINYNNSPSTLSELITSLHRELSTGGLDTVDVSRIQHLMTSYASNKSDWDQYAHFDFSKRYTRNLVDDGNGKFNLMILCWTNGQESPIHDHSNSHCIMKVLEGELLETRYAWPEKDGKLNKNTENMVHEEMKVTDEARCGLDECVYIHDKIGLHRVTNPSETQPAVSLHLYTPPFETCRTFDKKTGVSRASGKCTYYSVMGKKVVYNFSSVGNKESGSCNITDSGYEECN
jgi:cysteine dioxygenase